MDAEENLALLLLLPILAVVIFAPLGVLGAVIIRKTRRDLDITRRPAVPAARAQLGATVVLHGTVVASRDLVQSPVTGRWGVSCMVYGAYDATDGTTDEAVFNESKPFVVRDGSGVDVHVLPQDAMLTVPREWLLDNARPPQSAFAAVLGTVNEHQRQWVLSRMSTERGGKPLEYVEERLLQQGQRVIASGVLVDAGGTRRLVPGKHAVELIAGTARETRSQASVALIIGIGMVVLSVAGVLGGLVAAGFVLAQMLGGR